MSRHLASVIYIAIGIVLVALVWMVLGAAGAGIEAGIQSIRPALEPYGPAVPIGFMATAMAGMIWWALWLQRREQRRLYAIDRTIHVVPKHKPPLWSLIGSAIVFGMVALGMLGGFLSLFS